MGYAQRTGAATITGTVTDSSGAFIPGVKVKAVNTENGFNFDSVTNNDGYFFVPYLRPGVYNLSIEAQGFKDTCVMRSNCAPTTSRGST